MIDEISHLGFSSSAYQGRYRKMRILIHFWGQKSDSQLMEIEREIVCKKSSQASVAKGRGRLGNASNCCRKWWLDFFPFSSLILSSHELAIDFSQLPFWIFHCWYFIQILLSFLQNFSIFSFPSEATVWVDNFVTFVVMRLSSQHVTHF